MCEYKAKARPLRGDNKTKQKQTFIYLYLRENTLIIRRLVFAQKKSIQVQKNCNKSKVYEYI